MYFFEKVQYLRIFFAVFLDYPLVTILRFKILVACDLFEKVNLYIFWIKTISDHLDPILVIFGQNVNIRIYNQSHDFWYCIIPINVLGISEV